VTSSWSFILQENSEFPLRQNYTYHSQRNFVRDVQAIV